MILTFRPIKVWPDGWRQSKVRPSTPFYSSYAQTLDVLDRELRHLGAREATLQVAATEADVRLDGGLRANATVSHPGVILTVETRRHGTQVYATDRFSHWQANLRAITLGLEALRKVERYGIAERGQQYAGYREIGSGVPLGPGKMSVDEAARFLVEHGEWGGELGDPKVLIEDRTVLDAYWREAAKRLHPDVGGDPDLFRRLTEARNLLVGSA